MPTAMSYNTSRPYTRRSDGSLAWIWENPIRVKLKEGKDKMSEKKKKCYFCKRVLKAKIYYVELHEDKITLCSMCKFIYHTLNEEYVNRGLKIVDEIIASIQYDKRHCINCRNLNEDNKGYCFRDMWTGIGSHQREYPSSFANHGCSNFRPRF